MGSHGEGTGQVVSHSLRKHLHVHVSSPPSPWLLIDPSVQRWLPVLEIRVYYRDKLGARQLRRQEKIKAGPGSEERCSHYDPNGFYKSLCRASLVAQWLRICLRMQETRVRALVWEDPTCHGTAGPVSHSC